jgi:hypothetical protein
MNRWIRWAVGLLPVCGILLLIAPAASAQDARDEAQQMSGTATVKLDPNYRGPVVPTEGNLLYDNGPLINNPGGGVGGADESVLQNTSLGMTTLGFGHQFLSNNRMADDFVVDSPFGWTIDSLVFYAYQTFSGTTSTMTGVYYQIWDGPPNDPGSTVIFGDLTTNRMVATSWTNIYRVSELTSGGNTDRPVMKNTASAGVTLDAGTYWIDWFTNGSLGSGPWAPPITINGQTTTGNGLQFLGSTGIWGAANDGGTLTQQGLPFLVYGTEEVSTDPVIAFSPASMTFDQAADVVDSATLTISNVGGAPLNFTLSDDEAFGMRIIRTPVVEEAVELAKGQPDYRQGTPQLNGAGGPDAFGHFWIDSDEPGGPTFNWVDISSGGTAVTLGDDASIEVPLPFTFDFFGSSMSNVKICSNGYLTFTDVGQDFSNDPIPSSTGDDDLIAGFWDDLDPSDVGGGTIHYLGTATEFTVQWTGIERYNEPTSVMTFQVILYPNGEVVAQYLSMTGTLNSATAGIENVGGTDGLQVVYNAAYLHDNLAVRYYVPAGGGGWLSQNPTGGTVNPGESVDVQIIANSTGLTPGTYTANVLIMSDDPMHPDTSMPVTLNVLGADPVIGVDPTSISRSLSPGDSVDVIVTISNTGLADLDWSGAVTASQLRGTTAGGRKVELTTRPQGVPAFQGAARSAEGFAGRRSSPPSVEGGISLILDDGSIENDVGIGGGQWLWLNRFTPASSDFPFTLDEVQLLFDAGIGVDIGELVDIYVYEDTDGDGDPGTGAVHLGSILNAAVQAADAVTWSVYPTSVTLNGPGDVLIAVATRTAGTNAGEFPAAIDQTASQARSWAGIYSGDPPNPPTLPADALWGEIGTFGLPGNWMLRGYGTPVVTGPEWLSLIGVTSGMIMPGGSAELTVRMRALATEADTTYNGTIEITSNDPVTPSVLVSVTLDVITIPPAEAWTDHVTSAYTGTISNEGNIGYINGFPGQGGVGNGFTFNGGQRLFEGGLMIGTDSTHVSNAARDDAQLFDADFQFLANIDTAVNGTTTTYTTSYNDALAESPIGLRVDQATFSFNEAGKNNIMIIQLDIVNETGDNLSGVVTGAYFDWDVASTANDRGAVIVDSLNSIPEVNGGDPFPFDLVEIHPGTGANAYMGVVPLDTSNFYGRRVAIQGTEVYPPHMTDGDKWRYMTSLRSTNPNGDGGSAQDHGAVFGIGPYDILADQTIRVGFAIAAGTTLQACVDAAQEAQRIWVQELGNTLRAPFSTGVAEGPGLPEEFALGQNYPNPFNPETRIAYALPEQASVTLRIYNLLGQEVVTLADKVQEAGYHHVVWNGRNSTGSSVGTGVYFYRFEAKGTSGATFSNLKKMLFLK